MSEKEERDERPYLHCLIVELIDEFFAEYPATSGASDNVERTRQMKASMRSRKPLQS
jgi:hypothetical protein